MTFVRDTFTDADGTLLSAHTGETGATWTKHASYAPTAKITDANRVRGTSTSLTVYYASGVPVNADYDVEAVLRVITETTSPAGIAGRIDTGADTLYVARYNANTDVWELFKRVGAYSRAAR